MSALTFYEVLRLDFQALHTHKWGQNYKNS